MRIADDRAATNAGNAAAFAAALPPGPAQNAAMMAAFYLWMKRDRQAALTWTIQLRDEATRRAALREVSRRLVAAGARDAVVLVSGLPLGPRRDEALCGVANQWAKTDRGAVQAWADGLDDSALRAEIRAAISD